MATNSRERLEAVLNFNIRNEENQGKGVAEWLQTVSENELAALHMEAEAERGWDERFAASQNQLGALVNEAREEVARGDVSPFDPSNRPQK